MISCEIGMKLPSLNEYINVCRRNRYEAANYKARLESAIGLFIGELPKFNKPIRIRFHWIEGNKKRDLDNVAFAKKFILDSMVKLGKLEDDTRKHVVGFEDTFSYDDSWSVILFITEADGNDAR